MKSLLSGAVPEPLLRWYSIKLFERDTRVVKQLSLPESVKVKFEEMTIACEEQFDDDSESIITNERYEYISQLVSQYVKKSIQGNLKVMFASANEKFLKKILNTVRKFAKFA